MEVGELLASGRDADVFAVDAERVLRRYRDGGDVSVEATVMGYVGELGYPVPTVYDAGGADIVMERLDGPTMLESLVAGEMGEQAGGELLADLHNRLHLLPPRLSPDLAARILHLDLHPGNVILCARGPVVIDWCNTREGPPDLDVALSALILAQVGVGDHQISASARALMTAFLGVVEGEPATMLEQAVAMRGRDPNLSRGEVDLLAAAADLLLANL